MATKYEYYDSGDDAQGGFYGSTWQAQTFTTTSAFTITSVKLLVAREGVSGTLTISIRAVDGSNKPTGADLCSKAIDSTILTTNKNTGEWYDFVFGTPYALSATTRYAIVARCTGTGVSDRCYWRIDQTSPSYTNGEELFSSDSGSSWTALSSIDRLFETWGNPLVPSKPVNPTPSDAAADVTLDQATITWEDGGGATSYNIYYGDTSGNLTLVSEGQAGLSFTILDITLGSPFDYLITRYWRVDAINDGGTTTGDEWSFISIAFDQIRVSYRLISGGSGQGPYDSPPGVQGTDWEWTGESNMITVKRLVAAANDKIWYESI